MKHLLKIPLHENSDCEELYGVITLKEAGELWPKVSRGSMKNAYMRGYVRWRYSGGTILLCYNDMCIAYGKPIKEIAK